MNAGDFLMICKMQHITNPAYCVIYINRGSNDLIKSTMHRVRAPASPKTMDGMIPDRYSVVYVGDFSSIHLFESLTRRVVVLRNGLSNYEKAEGQLSLSVFIYFTGPR